MLEVELKYRVGAFERMARELASLRAVPKGSVEHVDTYFAHPCRDFAATDEALRIRRVGECSFVTYKGPKVDTETKTRREIEVPLADGAEAADLSAELLASLGFRTVAAVHKKRTTYHLAWDGRPVEIAMDEVDQLGTFVEIEAAASDSELNAARNAIRSLASRLGLEAGERRSYLEMLLERQRAGC